MLDILAHAGFSPQVLSQEVRSFLADRNVGLRYQLALPKDVSIEDEIVAANRFVSWCAKQLRRRTRPQRTGTRRRSTP
ncbi:hypothetical protein AB0E08_40380 [Streptomyces sp. NPDC048281]|uniref:hypothetical protein n=1 Tax=Streptomyces sp. NPDC048281 TaxID=3154715 RepID=UPI003447ABC8